MASPAATRSTVHHLRLPASERSAQPDARPTQPDGRPMATAPLPGTEHLGPSERGQYPEWTHVDRLIENPDNPRTGPGAGERDQYAADDNIAELAASIRSVGLLEPPVVAPAGPTHPDGTFLVVMGHRRTRAVRLLTTTLGEDGEPAHDGRVLVIVRPDLADAANPGLASAAALVENLQRVDLTPLQEARAFLALRDVHGWSQVAIARTVGRNPSHITRRLALLDAVPLLTELIEAGTVPLEVAVDLARLPEEFQQRAARDIVRGQASPTQARSQALADHDAASARTQALRSLDAAGIAYVELDHGRRPPAPSPHGPLPVDFPGYPHVFDAHDRPAGLGALPCETRFVTRHRSTQVVADPGANSYPGFDPAFVTGRWCTDPRTHAPAVSGSGPSSEVPDGEAAPAQPSARARLFSDGSGYVPGGLAGLPADPDARPSTPALAVPAGVARAQDRGVTEATMLRTAFVHRLLADRVPAQAHAAITAAVLTYTALAPEFVLDPAEEQGALRLACQLLGAGQAPLDASPTAARKAALHATFGPTAGTERRSRFVLALLIARAEPSILEAVARVAANPGSPDVPPVSAVLAKQTLTMLEAWGHVLHPLEQLVVDAAPSPHEALASLGIGVDVFAPLAPLDAPASADVAPAAAPATAPTPAQVHRMLKDDLEDALRALGAPVPPDASRDVLRRAVLDALPDTVPSPTPA